VYDVQYNIVRCTAENVILTICFVGSSKIGKYNIFTTHTKTIVTIEIQLNGQILLVFETFTSIHWRNTVHKKLYEFIC